MSPIDKRLYTIVIIGAIVLLPFEGLAQKIKLTHGTLSRLKGETSYNIKFTYDSMMVGSDTPEQKYLQQKRNDWELKEPGKGSEFVHQWFDDREEYYEPAFIANFQKYSKRQLKDKKAIFTLVVRTRRTEGGWYAGVMGHPGEIDGELHVVESANPANTIAVISFTEIHGKALSGGDFEMSLRIRDAYAVAGKWLGDYIRKKSKIMASER